MADEIDTLLDGEEKDSPSVTRIKELNRKVQLTARERDEQIALLKQKDEELVKEKKNYQFLEGYSDMAIKYPNAREHRDEIKAKVLAGYDIEDATVSVLAKAGKLNAPETKVDRKESVGGSASTNVSGGTEKRVEEMTSVERKAKLVEELRKLGMN